LKRLIDIVASLVGMMFLALPMVVIAFLVAIYLGRPIIFRQQRPGLDGQPFELLKFRTMTDSADEAGVLLPDDQRLAKLGVFLREWSLDELPELANIFVGEMSLVGPRPLLMEYMDLYSAEQSRRHEVRPGITGWAQINGRNVLSWEEKFALDVWYVDNRSNWLDFKILLLTVMKVLKREGISQKGQVTMCRFRGTGGQ